MYREKIKMILTDCDGVLTDGGMYYSENGDELKKFNTKDGMGFALLKDAGYITGIITGEDTVIVKRRGAKMKMDEVCVGIKDKLKTAKELCDKYHLQLENILYIGDDVNDLELIQAAGIGCCVADAMNIVKNSADYITASTGGSGVIREIINHFNLLEGVDV